MFIKRITAILLAFILCLGIVGCASNENPTISGNDSDNSSSQIPSEPEPEPEPEKYLNILTGELSLTDKNATNKKPVAVMINNIRVAQKVQTGLHRADVVFETEVEGGITRLLAMFADPTDVGKIGTIRSLRVVFADLACGMNALLFYHGIDNVYCTPHLKTIKLSSYQVGDNRYAFREKNGLAYEHRLYTTGEKLDNAIEKQKMKDEGDGKTWLKFSESTEKTAPSESVAKTISVSFSSTTTTQFLYDETLQKYARARKGVEYKDAVSGDRELFTNVFVLKTSITNYPNNKHRKVSLDSGDGYYASAGGVIPIRWEKGSSQNNFKFYLQDGTKLTVNQGNSYVCIMNKSREATFE